MIEILNPLSKGLLELTGVLSIGLIIAIAFLDKDVKGEVTDHALTTKLKKFLVIWLLSISIFILVQIAYLLDQLVKSF